MMYVYTYLFFINYLLFFSSSMILYYFKLELIIEWLLMSLNSYMIEIYILIDWISCLFISFVLLISSMVIMYSMIYMMNDIYINRFMYLLIMFVVSMILMILSPNLFSILFGWDMLGLISYCLIIYYQNYYSFNSGMVTVLSNRIGDVGLLMSIGLMIIFGSWNIYLIKEWKLLMFMILIASLTKSAQIPFSSWLPLAMAAPTPISSLVHSSTLVTAGVYLIIRFNKFIILTELNFFLLYISLITMIFSGIIANYEYDLKKIIALSTLSQLGFMMMILSLGFSLLSFYHLLTHAIFKSLMFMCAGAMIHVFKGNQDIRFYGGAKMILPFIVTSFFIVILSLMGFPFLAGFYSKDLIMEMLYLWEMNFMYLLMSLFSLSLTVMYSLRLIFYIYFGSIKFNSVMMINEMVKMNLSMMLLMIFSMIIGSILNWIFFFDYFFIFLKNFMKFLTWNFIFLGGSAWIMIFAIKDILKNKNLILFMISLCFMNFSYMKISKSLLYFSEFMNFFDLIWIENVESIFFLKVKMFLMKFYYMKFKLYYIMYFQLFFLLFFFIIVIL